MSHHRARIVWDRAGRPFTYEEYSRGARHHLRRRRLGCTRRPLGSFSGNAALPNPEELLVAALCNCHMLTFIAIAARKGFVVEKYEDNAEGIARDERRRGRMAVTVVELRPKLLPSARGSASTTRR